MQGDNTSGRIGQKSDPPNDPITQEFPIGTGNGKHLGTQYAITNPETNETKYRYGKVDQDHKLSDGVYGLREGWDIQIDRPILLVESHRDNDKVFNYFGGNFHVISSGSTKNSFPKDVLEKLLKHRQVILIPDNDAVGIALMTKAADQLIELGKPNEGILMVDIASHVQHEGDDIGDIIDGSSR